MRLIFYEMFVDYDKKRLRYVEQEVRRLQKQFSLGKAIVKLSSKRGRRRNYHVEFPEADLKSQKEVVEVLKHTSCDPKFFLCAENLGLSVLRIAPSKWKQEIKVVKVIESTTTE